MFESRAFKNVTHHNTIIIIKRIKPDSKMNKPLATGMVDNKGNICLVTSFWLFQPKWAHFITQKSNDNKMITADKTVHSVE